MAIFRARAPLRLGLAGGGSDVAPYSETYGGYVLNATINQYAYATLTPLNSSGVIFRAQDLGLEVHISAAELLPLSDELMLHHAVYNYFMLNHCGGRLKAVELTTYCDAPPGSGLGSSSTLVVAMIRVFVEYLNLPLDDYAIAQLAYKIEREECGLHGGQQDQYAAAFGGFNFMEFRADNRTIINPLRIKNWIKCELESSILLYSTGISRSSAEIIRDQSRSVQKGAEVALEAMHGIKQEAVIMKDSLLRGDFPSLASSIRQGWISKKRSAGSVSNAHLDSIYEAAIEAGATAGKVSGAGGGGFFWFFVPPKDRAQVIEALKSFGGSSGNCYFSEQGVQSWRIG